MTEKRNDKKEGSGMTRRGMGNHEANRGSGGREDAGMAAERVGETALEYFVILVV